MLNPSSLGRDGAPKLAYQSGYNFGFLIYVVQGAFAQFESKIGGGVIGPTYYICLKPDDVFARCRSSKAFHKIATVVE